MWNPEKYDEKAREVMQASSSLAKKDAKLWSIYHVAIALLDSGHVTDILQSIKVNPQQVTECLALLRGRERTCNIRSYNSGDSFEQSFDLRRFVSKIEAESDRLNAAVRRGDLLLALTDPQRDPMIDISPAPIDIASILASFGITKEAVRKALADIPKP